MRVSDNPDRKDRTTRIWVSVTDNASVGAYVTIHQAALGLDYNPLAYVARFDVNIDGSGKPVFVSSAPYANTASQYYSYEEAMRRFGPSFHMSGRGEESSTYHLPRLEEMLSIFPTGGLLQFKDVSHPSNTGRADDLYNQIELSPNLADTHLDIGVNRHVYPQNGVRGDFHRSTYYTVALRFLDTPYRSAWKYEYMWGDGKQTALYVTCRNVGSEVTLEDIEREDFWTTNDEDDVKRYFPAVESEKTKNQSGTNRKKAWYWTQRYIMDAAGQKSRVFTFYLDFTTAQGDLISANLVDPTGTTTTRFAVRLFSDTPLPKDDGIGH